MSAKIRERFHEMSARPAFFGVALIVLGTAAYYISAMYRRQAKRRQRGAVGDTPLILLKNVSIHFSRLCGRNVEVYGKCEMLNAGGSSKDRVACAVLDKLDTLVADDERHKHTVYEGTVGSTGISLAWQCRQRGYKCHIVMPSDVAMDKVKMLGVLGAHVERVAPASIVDPLQYVNLAQRRAADDEHGHFADQFETLCNFTSHFTATGPELY